MAARQENVSKGGKIEVAHWGKVEEMRERFLQSLSGRVGEMAVTKDGPMLPITPPLTRGEVKITKSMGRIAQASVFTFTSKMSCASFSLAAGPLKNKGTCLASNMSEDRFKSVTREVEAEGGFADAATTSQGHRISVEGKSVKPERVRLGYICDLCYAGKNNYARLDIVQVLQIVRKIWVDRAIARKSFVDEMSSALSALLENESLLAQNRASDRFFRIHDSGDFFSPDYFVGWAEVCARFEGRVVFWCPTRMWVTKDWRDLFAAHKPKNLVLRPSALVYDAEAPLVKGMDAGSTSSSTPMRERNHWDCPAYQSLYSSCASACCRTCWMSPQVRVNYMVH